MYFFFFVPSNLEILVVVNGKLNPIIRKILALAAISLVFGGFACATTCMMLLTTNTTPSHTILTDGKDINDVISNSSGLEHRPDTRAKVPKWNFYTSFPMSMFFDGEVREK